MLRRSPEPGSVEASTASAIEAERLTENQVRVSDVTGELHPLVASTFRTLRAGGVWNDGRIRTRPDECLDVAVSRENLDRAERIMEALLKALSARSIAVSVREQPKWECHTVAMLMGEEVAFRLWEQRRRVRPMVKPNPDVFNTPELELTGLLRLEILTHGGRATRRSWGDGRKQMVEECLNAFIISLREIADACRRRTAQREREKAARAEEERVRQEQEARRKGEQERLNQLLADADAWHRSQRLREFMAAVMSKFEQLPAEKQTDSLRRYLDWANRQADRIDPLKQDEAP